jgi:hypothetical protein
MGRSASFALIANMARQRHKLCLCAVSMPLSIDQYYSLYLSIQGFLGSFLSFHLIYSILALTDILGLLSGFRTQLADASFSSTQIKISETHHVV